MTQGPAPICLTCKHFDEDEFLCAAFPGGIPEDILLSGFIHDKPYPGDGGFQYVRDPDKPGPYLKAGKIIRR